MVGVRAVVWWVNTRRLGRFLDFISGIDWVKFSVRGK